MVAQLRREQEKPVYNAFDLGKDDAKNVSRGGLVQLEGHPETDDPKVIAAVRPDGHAVTAQDVHNVGVEADEVGRHCWGGCCVLCKVEMNLVRPRTVAMVIISDAGLPEISREILYADLLIPRSAIISIFMCPDASILFRGSTSDRGF